MRPSTWTGSPGHLSFLASQILPEFRIRIDPGVFADPDPDFVNRIRIRPIFALIYSKSINEIMKIRYKTLIYFTQSYEV